TTLGIIGTGQQARTQLLAVAAVRPLRSILAYGRDEARREAFAQEMTQRSGVQVRPVSSAEEAVREADVVVTMTTARDPAVKGEWLRPGTHVNAAGSNWAIRREVDDATVERSAVVAVDSKEQALLEAGDLVIAAAAGRFDWAQAVELGQIVAGQVNGRPSTDTNTLFKSLGIALEDIATAGLVYTLARERGLGMELDILG
ncbi:MAG TPA: ornithine cyclodeaminase family protein, partial [Ktedonobacterales bacterium]